MRRQTLTRTPPRPELLPALITAAMWGVLLAYAVTEWAAA